MPLLITIYISQPLIHAIEWQSCPLCIHICMAQQGPLMENTAILASAFGYGIAAVCVYTITAVQSAVYSPVIQQYNWRSPSVLQGCSQHSAKGLLPVE